MYYSVSPKCTAECTRSHRAY